MTSTSVKGVNLFGAGQTGQKGKTAKNGDAFDEFFSQICNRNQSGQQENAANAMKTGKTGTKTEMSVHKSLRDKMPKEAENATEKAAEEMTEEELERMSAEAGILGAAEQIVAEIAKQLGMTVEEVMEAMQQMQIAPEELLNSGSITDLMIALSGGEGEVNLLTDEALYQAVKEVTQTLESVMAELEEQTGMSAEELEAMIAKAVQQNKNGEMQDADGTVSEIENAQDVKADAKEQLPMVGLQTEEPQESVTDSTLSQNEQMQTGKAKETAANQSESKNSGEKQESEQGNGFLQQLNGQDARVNTEQLVQESGSTAQRADTEQILKQIVDYMKIQVKADMTQMELQLQPASLGHLTISIASKNGMITAQFTAQNEAVKTALESQIVQLRESLNEQGVKVEAVEVTIASHEFERNLEQNQSNAGQRQSENRSGSRRSRSSLNLAGMEETDMEELDEAQKIAADMMVRNGNSVDFSA